MVRGGLEKKIEGRFVRRVRRETDWAIYKLWFIGVRGAPDRILFMPHRRIEFIEFKRRRAKPRKLQLRMHRILRGYGYKVRVIDSDEKAQAYFTRLVRIARVSEDRCPRTRKE